MIPIPALGLAVWLKIAAVSAVVIFVLGSCMARDARLKREAVAKAITKIENANETVVKKARRAADRSLDPGVRGTIDPTTRD